MSTATLMTTANETAFLVKSSAETNHCQPINPQIDNSAARKAVDQAADIPGGRTVSLLVMLNLDSIAPLSPSTDVRTRMSEARLS